MDRRPILSAIDDDTEVIEALRLALEQAVAELGGMGGMAHMREYGHGREHNLRLVASSGLPRIMTEPWVSLDDRGDSPTARAVRAEGPVWVPAPPLPGEPSPRPSAAPAPGLPGAASVPVSDPDGVIGSLTVLAAARSEPGPEQWAFLEAVAAWAAERLRRPLPPGPPQPHEKPSPASPPGSGLRQALNAVHVGSYDWNMVTGELLLDEAAMTVLGIDPQTFDRRTETWMDIIHPDDLPSLTIATDKAIRDRSMFGTEYRVNRPDGTTGWIQVRGRVQCDENDLPLGTVGTVWDSTESRSARDAVGRALRYMSDGFLALDHEWLITFLNTQAERVLGRGQELVGHPVWDLAAELDVPDLRALCQKTVALSTPTGLDIRAPGTRRWYHLRLVPLPDGLAFYFTDIHAKRTRDAEREAAVRADAERAARIAELTAALASATGAADVTDAVARHVLPPFGAVGMVVQVIEGTRMHPVGSVGYSQEFLDRITGLSLSGHNAVADALAARTPQFFSSPEEYVARYPALADHPEAAGKKAWAFLPLVASDHPIGVCVISFDRPRDLTGEERTLLVAISGFVAQALERARLFDAEHTRAQELQRALLPQALPSLPACTATARYLPAGQGMDVGGDWYDIIPLSSDRVALVIGDVMGHGLPEAATMGRLRTAVHTLAELDLPPDEILAHLNDIVSGLGDDSYATCLYAVYDPVTHGCAFARAGHPPPAVVHADGTVVFPDSAPNPPLGAAEPPFENVELVLPENSLLILYTDGLVESVDRDIEAGMARLARLLAENRGGDLDLLCDKLIAGLLPVQQQSADDAALLAVRVHGLPPDAIAAWPLPLEPQAAGQARKLVREQLSIWSLDELAMTTELLVSELVANVVRYARGPVLLRLLHSRTLVCEVSDGSLTTPRIRRASETDEGGRGLQLVAALSQRWGTRYTATGKCIWTEQALTGPESPDALLAVLDPTM
ncbi:SpoIIE family protein phosphatase [Streptomyces sp. NBC_00075]|uniref:SpoIIE family protein phosphatase n=1 Tax=Streptomyces sp. NBC_00075 TaxID=2975641 RepID=UPI0032569620